MTAHTIERMGLVNLNAANPRKTLLKSFLECGCTGLQPIATTGASSGVRQLPFPREWAASRNVPLSKGREQAKAALERAFGLLFLALSALESTDLCGHPLMPPNWFLQLWTGQGGRG